MYDFAIVALLGLAAYKTVDFLTGLAHRDDPTTRLVATLGMGIAFAFVLDYSLFAAWGIGVRETWMGPLFTGLIVGATTYAWHGILAYVEGRRRDEQRMSRAA